MDRTWQECDFDLFAFKTQLEKFAKNPGALLRMTRSLPGLGEFAQALQRGDYAKHFMRIVGIINSMTPSERCSPLLVNADRRLRIAHGAGVQADEVDQLLRFKLLFDMRFVVGGHLPKDRG
jgi:signal recognition particle subunit SRP54